MFSARFARSLAPNALTLELQALREQGKPLLDLTGSNPTRAGFSYPTGEILAALARPACLTYDPHPAGLPAAREAAAATYAAHGVAVEPARVLLTASTSEGYSYLFKLLTDPDDEVLVPVPSYPLFDWLATMEGVQLRPYRLQYSTRWSVDLDSVRAAISPRTRAIIVVNPNNPTGSYLRTAEAETLLTLSERHGLALIGDEVFADYPARPGADRCSTLAGAGRGLAFCMGGLSKSAGLPQLKLGWVTAAGDPAMVDRAWERLELIADTYLSVGAPIQHALPGLLAMAPGIREQIAGRVAANRELLARAVGAHPECEVLDCEGGWCGTIRIPATRGEEAWALEFLRRDGVLVHPGYFFDFPSEAYLVVSLLVPPETLAEGLARILERLRHP